MKNELYNLYNEKRKNSNVRIFLIISIVLLLIILLVLLFLVNSQRSSDVDQKFLKSNDSNATPSNIAKDIQIYQTLLGRWRLLIYAGKTDSMLERGKGELLIIKNGKINLHLNSNVLAPSNFTINKFEEVYSDKNYKYVLWKRSNVNILLTIILKISETVIWRGSYVSENFYQEIQQSNQLSMAALANLPVCMKYWYDLYENGKSPRDIEAPMKIYSVGYSK